MPGPTAAEAAHSPVSAASKQRMLGRKLWGDAAGAAQWFTVQLPEPPLLVQ